MSLKCGIVGLPNVGKSTLFNALTASKNAEAANFPFCTIDPNIGIVDVVDNRLDQLAKLSKSKRKIYTNITFVDIAGLVKGASKGEGLGNKFLSNLYEVDALIHLVRCFNDNNITHVDDNLSPTNDIEVIETELLLADLSKIENILENLRKKNKGNKDDEQLINSLEKGWEILSAGSFLKENDFDNTTRGILHSYNFLTQKPLIYVCNVDENSIQSGNRLSKEVSYFAQKKKCRSMNISAAIEAEISQIIDENEKQEFLLSLNMEQTSLSRLIEEGYGLLDLITFFTSGPKESKAWSCKKGTKAPDAGAKIHTDFKRGFIKAEVISLEDFLNYNGEQNCKDNGKLKFEGKDYIVKDGDIITFRFNT